MANYSAIKAAVNAYIKANGRKEITGMILNSVLNATIDSLGRFFQFAGGAIPADDPGTPDQNVCYLATEPGVYTNFGGITIENEEVALLFWNGTWTKQRILIGIQEVNASVDDQVGTPSVDVSYSQGRLVLTFHNLKGEQGDTGDPAGFGTIGADVTGGVGTPGVSVETSGDNAAKNIMFHFTNLKGEAGVTSVVATIDDTSGTPSCQVSLVNGQLTLAFSGLKGLKGDTGVSADYPITIYNGLDSDATDQALAAAQGKVLQDEISQLEAEVHNLSGKYYGLFATSADLPEGDATGYAFVGTEAPFAIWNFDGEEWADSGATVDGITGVPGVGFESVASPDPADGTAIITLSNGDTITLDLNHTHSQYTKVYVCANQAEYDAITTKDSMTLYLIPEVALYFGDTLIIEQNNPLPYTPVEWIATDGVAYINTGIKGNSPMSASCKMLPVAPSTGTAYFFGHRSSTNGRFVFLMIGSNKYAGFTYASSAYTTAIDVSTSIDNQTPIEVKTSVKTGEQKFSVRKQGDAQYTDFSDIMQTTVSDGIDILLFCYNNQGTPSTPQSGTRCYGAKIYSDADFGTMLFNGIPCYFNGEYGLWDLVSNSFFGNDAGSGAFTGPQI